MSGIDSLASIGVAGVVLIWFMVRLEGFLTKVEIALNRNTETLIKVEAVIENCQRGTKNGEQ